MNQRTSQWPNALALAFCFRRRRCLPASFEARAWKYVHVCVSASACVSGITGGRGARASVSRAVLSFRGSALE